MKVVTFGELLLRLSPPGFQRFVQASAFDVSFGGAEANVAVALAQWGVDAVFVSKAPAHEIGEAAVGALRRYGVGVQHVARGGERLGAYFLEHGASQRSPKVIYDRAGSAFASIGPGEIDWAAALEGADVFHWTGITAALGERPRAALAEGIAAARAAGARVSVDLNYRAKLWSVEQARAVMRPLVAGADVCIAGREDADHCLGLAAEPGGAGSDAPSEAAYGRLAERLRVEFGFGTVALSLRESFSASRHGWSGLVCAQGAAPVRSRRYEIALVDRVGGGDAFAAGVLYGLHAGDASYAAEFAAAASCLQQTVPGDFSHSNVEEVARLAGSGHGGRVER